METVTLNLSNGQKIENLTVNGNCLISDADVSDTLLTDILLSSVTVGDVTYENVTLARKWVDEGKTWLALRQKTDEEIRTENTKSTLEYIAMMSDVDLEV